MPVEKFRTFDQARRALWLSFDDPRRLLRLRHLGTIARSRRPIQRGVTRLRTIEEAKRDKGAAWQVHPDLSGGVAGPRRVATTPDTSLSPPPSR